MTHQTRAAQKSRISSRGRVTPDEAGGRGFGQTGEVNMFRQSGVNVSLMCAASLLALSGAAWAQGAEQVESVTVTGSRIISDITQSPTPLTLVTADQLQANTPTNIPDALQKLPVFLGNSSQRSLNNASSNSAGNTLNLRNFGAQRTLVLLDGHRVAPSNSNGTVDIDVLPQMLMTRVDVITGGASAIYGSDAVAGVVNFILDKQFTGVKYNVNAGISKYGDAAQHQFGIAAGTELLGGRAHVEGSFRYYHQDGVANTERPYGFGGNTWVQTGNGSVGNPYTTVPYGRDATRPLGGLIGCGSACAANGMTFGASPGVIVPFLPGTPTGTKGTNSGGDGGRNQVTSFMASLRTQEAFGRASYDLGSGTEAYIQVGWAESRNQHNWSPVTLFTNAGRPHEFFVDNVFLTQQAKNMLAGSTMRWPGSDPADPSYFTDPGYQFNKIDGVDARKLGATYFSISLDRNIDVTTGLSGTLFGKYTWDAYYSHGESRQKETNPNNTDDARLLAALDAVAGPSGTAVCHVSLTAYASLYPGCTPLNVFSTNGPSLDAYRWINRETHYIQTNVLDDIGASVSGPVFDLPAGPVNVALSAEMRWSLYDVQSNAIPTDPADCTGLRLCTPGTVLKWTQNTAASVTADNNVYEFAAEIGVPLLKDLPMIQELTADLAGRTTTYSTSGEAETWKIGLDYHVNTSVRFRGTMSVDIRAPNLNDLYQPLLISSAGFNDLYTGKNASAPLHTQGNAALTPEIAHTFTGGVVLTPDFIPDLTMSIDYYKINMSNAITALSYGNTAIQNICIDSIRAGGALSPYCGLAVRPNPISDNSPDNYPLYTISSSLNSANVRTEGIDFEIDYGFEMADIADWAPGSVNLRNLLSIQPYITTVGFPGASATYNVMPKGRMTTFFSYTLGDWRLNLQNTWLSGFKKANGPVTPTQNNYVAPRVGSFDTLDVTIDRRFDLAGGDADLYLSVQNIGNTQPPLNPTSPTNPGLFYPVSSYESALGRYFTVGLRGNL
jgi:outer membrane receptor protein involved in Fe transport